MTFSFDFNHGATLPANDMRAPDICDRVNAHIDAMFLARREAEGRRQYVGASSIGNECLRSVQLGYLGANIDEGRITGRSLRIFNIGHRFEDIVAEWLRAAGFQLETIDPTTGKQFGFSILNGKGRGHIDGKIVGGPVPMAYPALWEAKALNNKAWQDVKKRGLYVSKPVYAGQVAIDQAYCDLLNPALFTALNKDTAELHHELVPFDQKLAQDMSDRMARVVDSSARQELIPRGFSSPESFGCQWCDFKKTCWSLPK